MNNAIVMKHADILPEDTDTVVDEVLDLDDDTRWAWACVSDLLERSVSRSETFAGFEIPLAEMWRGTPEPPSGGRRYDSQ